MKKNSGLSSFLAARSKAKLESCSNFTYAYTGSRFRPRSCPQSSAAQGSGSLKAVSLLKENKKGSTQKNKTERQKIGCAKIAQWSLWLSCVGIDLLP